MRATLTAAKPMTPTRSAEIEKASRVVIFLTSLIGLLLADLGSGINARAQSAAGSPAPNAPAAAPASATSPAGSVSGSKPLDVRGQSRMQALIQTQDDRAEIQFVKIRKDFREELLKTSY